jgi:plasmid maintenance system antidote protein VapI
VSGTRDITGETALRLARYFGTTAEYWINMQARYNLEVARDEFDAANKQIKPRNVLGESYAEWPKYSNSLKIRKLR